ncbi:MAG: FAD-dependent oxidoreductase [Limnochordia bacterium]
MTATKKRYVIIGNGVAGTTAAEQLKKEDPHCEIHLISEEPYPLYNRVALPPFLKGAVDEGKVMMRTVEAHAEKGIQLHLETRVERIDAEGRAVYTADGREFPYDKLLVATGGSANPLRVPGAEGTRYIYQFQTLDDTKEIIGRVLESKVAVVVGGSFIAYELTEAFRVRGLETVWLIRGPRFLWRVLDEAGGLLVDTIAREHGVTVVYGQEVKEVKASGGALEAVVTTGGETIHADLVGLGLGLTLNTGILEGTGVQVNKGVITDATLRTSDPHIYAAGDVAEFYDAVTGNHHTMGTWNNAASQGKQAALNMLGKEEPYVTVPTYTSGLFNSKLAVMGATPEISDELEGISHLDMERRVYRRLFFLGSRLVGAVLIGDMSPRRTLLQLIREGQPVTDRKALLHA